LLLFACEGQESKSSYIFVLTFIARSHLSSVASGGRLVLSGYEFRSSGVEPGAAGVDFIGFTHFMMVCSLFRLFGCDDQVLLITAGISIRLTRQSTGTRGSLYGLLQQCVDFQDNVALDLHLRV
jgi:hypothetical protein